MVYPFVWLLNTSSNGILKLLGFDPADEENQVYSQSEIIKLSRNAVHGGSLDKEDLTYMERAFELNDKVAKDIMTDRTRLSVLDSTDSIKYALKKYLEEGYSRFPVVRDNNKDDVVGYVYSYDIVQQNQIDGSVPVTRIIRTIITVPESMPIQDILHLMISKHTPIVLVVRIFMKSYLVPLKMKLMMFQMTTSLRIKMESFMFQVKQPYTTLKDFSILI